MTDKKYIDAQMLKEFYFGIYPDVDYNKSYSFFNEREIAYRIAACPAADVVEVVRCKDCKHSKECKTGGYGCRLWMITRMGDDFCSEGKRKEKTDG